MKNDSDKFEGYLFADRDGRIKENWRNFSRNLSSSNWISRASYLHLTFVKENFSLISSLCLLILNIFDCSNSYRLYLTYWMSREGILVGHDSESFPKKRSFYDQTPWQVQAAMKWALHNAKKGNFPGKKIYSLNLICLECGLKGKVCTVRKGTEAKLNLRTGIKNLV